MAFELMEQPAIISTRWTEQQLIEHIHFIANRTDNATLEVWVDYIEEDYDLAPSGISPAPIGSAGRTPTDREVFLVDGECADRSCCLGICAPYAADAGCD